MDVEHDLYNIEISPEYWVMTGKSATLIAVTLLLFVIISIVTARKNLHFN